MEYKERLIRELRELVIKITRLEVFYGENDNKLEKEKLELMTKQLESMYSYESILVERILLEMKNK